jgi:branched-chain amino acid transport system substrate-binding protein
MFRSLSIAAATIACLNSVAQAQEKPPIKIAVVNDQAGVYMEAGGPGSGVAARLAAEAFGGEVMGRKIEVIVLDHQNKADNAASLTRKLIDVDKVDMLADGASSAAGLAMNEVTRAAKKIFVVSGPAATNFTNAACSPTTFHFNYDTYALAKITSKAITEAGGRNWFFVTADYAFGHALQRDATKFIEAAGGKVVGAATHPLNTMDFSSFLLQAQASRADVVGLATSGKDVQTAIKQAGEFGIVRGGQKLAGLLVFITDVNALGLQTAQGLQITTSFYWDLTDKSRAWTKRFMAGHGGRVPSMIHAGTYSGVRHYLAAIQAAGTDDPKTVAAKMREMPVTDMYNAGVKIRPDGRVLHDMYLVQVKKPEESKSPFDFYKVLTKVSGEEAFRPLSESECPLVRK